MTFWIPQRLEDNRFQLVANRAGCVGIPGRFAMMGGVTSAAAITAMEQVTGRQLLWSATQFISHAPGETDFLIDVQTLKAGRSVTQAQATLSDGERVVLITSAALGELLENDSMQYQSATVDRVPERCPLKEGEGFGVAGDLFDQVERRVVSQNDEEGYEALWFRMPDTPTVSTATLAIIGDFLPGAVSVTRGSSSVDNTLRVHRLKPSRWLLAETQIDAIHDRLFQGTMRIFTEAGELLAVASQSGIRPRPA